MRHCDLGRRMVDLFFLLYAVKIYYEPMPSHRNFRILFCTSVSEIEKKMLHSVNHNHAMFYDSNPCASKNKTIKRYIVYVAFCLNNNDTKDRSAVM